MSKLLIVEDEESIADLEEKIIWSFRALRWRLKTRETPVLYGRIKEDFDLLILDLMLPEVDGF